MKKASFCIECAHYRYKQEGKIQCLRWHRPRFFMPNSGLDLNWGWKRMCEDFRQKEVVGEVAGEVESIADELIREPQPIQRCFLCGGPTGRSEEDSLIRGEVGPLCEDCYDNVFSKSMIKRITTQLKDRTK